MLNYIWLFLLAAGIIAAAINGRVDAITNAALTSARDAVEICFNLIGIMALWLGIMRIGEKSGLIGLLARGLKPVTVRLFPSLPPDHPAIGAIIMNLAANILGLGNAATPFGMKAMQELKELNGDSQEASTAMCTFLALNTSCITLIPATIIGIRLANNSANPVEIVGPCIFATGLSMIVGVSLDYWFRTHSRWRIR